MKLHNQHNNAHTMIGGMQNGTIFGESKESPLKKKVPQCIQVIDHFVVFRPSKKSKIRSQQQSSGGRLKIIHLKDIPPKDDFNVLWKPCVNVALHRNL